MESSQVDFKEKYLLLEEEFKTFSYLVSHDLGAPFRHIREFSKILIDDIKDEITEEQKQAVNFVQSSVNQCERMLDALLVYSRLNTVKQKITTFDVNLIQEHILHSHSSILKNKEITLDFVFELEAIRADKGRLLSLIVILIDNAINSESKERKLAIELKLCERDHHYMIAVKDNGIGIEKKFHQQIFNIFAKLESGTQRLGVGLTLAKKIAEQHAGKIWLTSIPNIGSTFFVSFPNSLS